MKFGSSSSWCKPRPAEDKPAQPVASLAMDAATRPAMRRRASVWAVGNAAMNTMSSRVPRVLLVPKATAVSPQQGEGRAHPAGCTTTARSNTQQEDGPGTWEAHVPPRQQPEQRRPGDHSPTRRAPVDARAAGRRHEGGPAPQKHPRRGRPPARGDSGTRCIDGGTPSLERAAANALVLPEDAGEPPIPATGVAQ
jgi:hypothetical protein